MVGAILFFHFVFNSTIIDRYPLFAVVFTSLHLIGLKTRDLVGGGVSVT